MKYFEEVFSTKNWMIRVFKVKKPSNTYHTNYFNTVTNMSPQHLSGLLDPSPVKNPTESSYTEKFFISEVLVDETIDKISA